MIETKPKKCKGQNKAKSVKGCGKVTLYRKYGLCQSCLAQFYLETDYGKVLMKKAEIKATKPRRELEKVEKERKETQKLGALLKQVEKYCHAYIRKRDEGKPCISCNEIWRPDFQCGHYFPAGKYSMLKFNEYNQNGQCPGCNLFKEGNFEAYSVNLPKRIGQDMFNDLYRIAAKEKQINFKWDRERLIEIRDYYKAKIKQL